METHSHLTSVPSDITPAAPQVRATVDQHGTRLDLGIEGVEYARLPPPRDRRGSLMEVFSPALGFWPQPIRFSHPVTLRPGRIKGWGMHRIQTDRYCVLGGRLRV